MMVRKYIIGENELCEFGEVMKNILDASLIESCRTKASDLLRILKKINIGNANVNKIWMLTGIIVLLLTIYVNYKYIIL